MAALARLSIKSKTTLVATLIFLASLAVVSTIQLYYVKAEMKRVLADQQFTLVSRVAEEIDQKLALSREALVANAKLIPMERLNDAEALQRGLAQRTTLNILFSDLFIHSPTGKIVADYPPLGRIGLDSSGQEFFRATLATRQPYISRPFLGRTLKQPVVTMSAPVFDGEGNVAAVLTGSLNLFKPNFLGNLGEAKVGRSGSLALFTHDRMIVISRDKDRVLTQGPAPGVSPYFDRATSGQEGSEEGINSRGLHAIFSYRQLQQVPWVLVASLPVEEAYAPIQVTQRRIMEVTLLLALLVAPLIWLGVRRLIAPLEVLRDTIRKVAQDPAAAHEVPVTRSDEIGDVATDFNAMLRARRQVAAERDRAYDDLSAKNAELARALSAKDRFLATMSHELRTPLNAIIGFTGTLLMKLPGPLNRDQEKQLITVRTSATHLLALINDLLDLAKIDAGKVELHLEPVSTREVIQEVVTSLRPAADAKNLRLVVETPEVVVQTDRRALRQIILNLANNAVKFTEHGSVRLHADRRVVDERPTVEISVSDTGIGVREEDQAKLFQAFTRVEDPAHAVREGTGLGLYLSQKLAALLGGYISVDSQPGRGSTFTLRIAEASDSI